MFRDKLPTASILLKRYGLVFLDESYKNCSEKSLKAMDIELAALAYLPSAGLREAFGRYSDQELGEIRDWILQILSAEIGADRKHEPLFRRFPRDVPDDTTSLWYKKVLCHFLQAADQACLFCRKVGTTHVLKPCEHVVCSNCFDGSNYSACPICGRQFDRTSPFFLEYSQLNILATKEAKSFKLLHLGDDFYDSAIGLLTDFFTSKQALSPVDKADLETLLNDFGAEVLDWLPREFSVKEIMAISLGSLAKSSSPEIMTKLLKAHLRTATDVLRFIAA